MHESSDVIIVGGGPCGSFTALNLAKLGCNVNVFEEHREIGVPSHCAGHLAIKGLQLLGLYPLPQEIVENTFYGVIVHSPKGSKLCIRYSSPVTCAVNRVLFDKYIAGMAEKYGAEYFLNSIVESLVIEDGFVNGVVVRCKEAEEKFSAKLVVDAEGVSSRIRRQAGLFTSSRYSIVKSVQAEVANVKDMDTDMVEVFLSRDYSPGFYAWLMPKQDGNAKVGLAAKTGNPRELLRRLLHKHPTASKKLRKAKILHTSFHSIPLGGLIPKAYSDGFLVVGDAASQVKPTTGGGVVFGMTCAKIAAEVVYRALCQENFSCDFLYAYQKQCEKMLGSEVKVMLRIRKMFDTLPDDKLDDVITFCAKIGLDKTFQNFEDIDFQGRSLFHMLWNPRMSTALFYFLISYLFANR